MGNSSSTPNGGPSNRSTTNVGTIGSQMSSMSTRITGGGSNNNAFGHRPTLPLPLASLTAPFRTGTGTLGLSRAELDARCQPSGLYPSCDWEPKAIRRLIGDGKLAARLKGVDSRLAKSDRECPICFLYYSENNVTQCCEATICTECYLQIKPQKEKIVTCPFCNHDKMTVLVQKQMDEDGIAQREEDEQRVIEATIRNRVAKWNGESVQQPENNNINNSNNNNNNPHEQTFGSFLEDYNRSRTLSNASSALSDGSMDGPVTPVKDEDVLISLAMSPDARRELEREMRAQLSHETHQRTEHEAEEARMRHVQEWSRTDSGIRSRMRETRFAEIASMLGRMRVDHDDLAALPGSSGTERVQSWGGILRALEGYDGPDRAPAHTGTSLEHLMRLEAAILMGQELENDTGRQRVSNRRVASVLDGTNDASGQIPFSVGLPGSHRRVIRTLPRRGVSSTHIDTAEMLLRGISEDDQIAMAIAMSVMEADGTQQQQGVEGDTLEEEASSAVSNERPINEVTSHENNPSNHEINAIATEDASLADDEEEVLFVTR